MAYKFIIKQKHLGQDVINVFCYEDDNAPNAINAGQIAQQIVDAWETELAPFMVPQWSLIGVDWTHTNALPGQPAQPLALNNIPVVGSAAGLPMPVQTAVYIKSQTIDGPPWRGGAYIGGWNSSLLGADGLVTQNRLDALQTFFDDIQTLPAVGLGNVARVIVSTNSKTVPAGTEALVATNTPNNNPSSLDKRRIGVGS